MLWLVRGADCGAEFFVKFQLHQRAEIRVDQLAGDFGLEPYEWALPVEFSESVILACLSSSRFLMVPEFFGRSAAGL